MARVAYLARLSLSPEESKSLSIQLSHILEHFEKVQGVDTSGVAPLITPTEIEPHWRDDRVEPEGNATTALANAPEAMGNLFKVPPVVG